MPFIITAVAAVIVLWIFLCLPNRLCNRARKFCGTSFAHRGLHSDTCSENSLSAFDKACEKGCGIELDVQFTKDKHIVVFHDNDTERMTGKKALVSELTLAELKKLQLVTDSASIPTFEEVLKTVNGRVPLLVEIKNCSDIKNLTIATADMLRKYTGAYVVESFNPICLMHLRNYAPEIIRGQLVTGRDDYKDQPGILAFLLSQLLLNVIARPDFIAYNHLSPMNAGLWLHSKICHTPSAVWTVTDSSMYKSLVSSGKMPIFEKIDI